MSPRSPSATLYSPTSGYSPTTVCYASPPASPYKRRKSSTTTEQLELRPKKGDDNYVKRPENAFILFRRKCCEDRQAAIETSPIPLKKERQADLSKSISAQWKALSTSERARWETMAKDRKTEHARLHPGYVYRPQRKGSRASASSGSEEGIVDVQPLPRRPRSSSNVETSSLMPMLEAVDGFDFVPELVPSFGQHSFWESLPDYPVTLDANSFSPEQAILPAHEITLHSEQTPPQFVDTYTSNTDALDLAVYEGYSAWDEAALSMWPQEQDDLFDYDLGSIAPYEFYPQQELAVGYQ